ncbi:hypothetical protein ALPO108162_03225 [Alicyclobacillus pomorum]
MTTNFLFIILYLIIDFAVGLLFMWAWGKLFHVQLKRGRMISGAILWSLLGTISVIVFHA